MKSWYVFRQCIDAFGQKVVTWIYVNPYQCRNTLSLGLQVLRQRTALCTWYSVKADFEYCIDVCINQGRETRNSGTNWHLFQLPVTGYEQWLHFGTMVWMADLARIQSICRHKSCSRQTPQNVEFNQFIPNKGKRSIYPSIYLRNRELILFWNNLWSIFKAQCLWL